MSLNYHCTCVCCDCCCLSPVCYLCCRACQNLGRYCPKLVYLCLESCAFLTDVSLRSLRSFCNAAFCTQTFLIQKKYKYWYYWALIHSLLCHCWFGAVSGILLSFTEKKSTLSALPFWFGISWAKWSTYPRNEVTETFSRKFLWVTGLHGKWPWNCWYLQNVKNIFILCQ